ncbi:glycosyltransferase [Sphingobacterium alkalisoli]|uniref:Glycosyltransferase n=1 Tax=Sphingobacterium alkalisoli TaxID=1874115 RepID=A0A4U0H8C2_9SPHI|nr:glycosyltransferase [Sphingobacterium alkalisoli]TJY68041.1 glycosyltransferase [Sphingobacterium alkalisoli]GGH09469.1 glycosyl transferase [Sphingobacterium alkalisoli]
MKSFAPIILFVYNRPHHTERTLDFLEKNTLAQNSDVYIYSDAAKSENDRDLVIKVRNLIKKPRLFKSVTIVERKENWGLSENVINGVSSVIDRYDKVIVFEDDLESSPLALEYFNTTLDLYEHEPKVMQISGYNLPLKDVINLPDAFFFRVVNSWGWATWKRAWDFFEGDINKLTKDLTKSDIYEFSIEGKENFWKQVKEFKHGKINSWAIRWYLSVFKQKGLVLYPRYSFIQNIGTDGSGTHSDIETTYAVQLATQLPDKFPTEIKENPVAFQSIKYFYAHRKGSPQKRLIRFLKKKWNNRRK